MTRACIQIWHSRDSARVHKPPYPNQTALPRLQRIFFSLNDKAEAFFVIFTIKFYLYIPTICTAAVQCATLSFCPTFIYCKTHMAICSIIAGRLVHQPHSFVFSSTQHTHTSKHIKIHIKVLAVADEHILVQRKGHFSKRCACAIPRWRCRRRREAVDWHPSFFFCQNCAQCVASTSVEVQSWSWKCHLNDGCLLRCRRAVAALPFHSSVMEQRSVRVSVCLVYIRVLIVGLM